MKVDLQSGVATQKRMLTPAQLRAARALVDWNRGELAAKSGISAETIKAFEWGNSQPKIPTANAWMRALRKAGVVFIEDDGLQGPGVRLKDSEEKKYLGER